MSLKYTGHVISIRPWFTNIIFHYFFLIVRSVKNKIYLKIFRKIFLFSKKIDFSKIFVLANDYKAFVFDYFDRSFFIFLNGLSR